MSALANVRRAYLYICLRRITLASLIHFFDLEME